MQVKASVQKLFQKKSRRQRGFTLVEGMISISVLSLVMGLGLNFYQRTQTTVLLAEAEAQMQMHSRMAMTSVGRELRMASDYFELPFPNVPQAKEIIFVRPKDDASQGNVSGYVLVRYWFHEHTNGVYSLMRAEKAHGSDARFVAGDSDFMPDAEDPVHVRTYRISSLVKEATVIEPGKQSFFQQDKTQPGLIGVRMVTATYGIKQNVGSNAKNQEVKRQFRIDTIVNARNLVQVKQQ
ncbi:MAG: hypothetical protein CVV27_05990 [Candidatus Melainabacteria bacterium HGW-Melainabacteria-1]|nr:MAG: hypothetical protein CVV27_05990 [Candidatus Melainabacteria bacterium HGW-Melainabacteria-1]